MPPGDLHGSAAAAGPVSERRAVPRVAPKQQLAAKVLSAQAVRILDISSRGAQIELVNSLQPSGRCDLRIQFSQGEFAVHATVRRCRAAGFGIDELNQRVVLFRAGLEFDEVDPESLAWLTSNVLFQAGG
ncbi:MAG TPA: PilZ domain-containing protein [Thermoanaerobaculaceae bacterium]|nr:PilZ domain-containing protein [Thermoanaerobaculaceae bacterium]